MSTSKLDYIYNSYDVIIDLIEADTDFSIILEKVRAFRDEMPTIKEIIQEYLDNSEALP